MPAASAESILRGLLLRLFATIEDLRLFVGDYDQAVEDAVVWEAGRATVADGVAAQLIARGHVGTALFEALEAELPRQAQAIREARELALRSQAPLGGFEPRFGSAGVRKETLEARDGAGLGDFAGQRENAPARGERGTERRGRPHRSVAVRLADEARRNLLALFPPAEAPSVDDLLEQLDWLDAELDGFEPDDALEQVVQVSLAAASLVGGTEPGRRQDLSSVLMLIKRVYGGLIERAEPSDQLMLSLASAYWALEEEAAVRHAVHESSAARKRPAPAFPLGGAQDSRTKTARTGPGAGAGALSQYGRRSR